MNCRGTDYSAKERKTMSSNFLTKAAHICLKVDTRILQKMLIFEYYTYYAFHLCIRNYNKGICW